MPTQLATTLETVDDLLDQVELLISTTAPLPENRTTRSLELLAGARAAVTDLSANKAVDAFAETLQTVAKWRRKAIGTGNYGDRDQFLERLRVIGLEIFGTDPVRQKPEKG